MGGFGLPGFQVTCAKVMQKLKKSGIRKTFMSQKSKKFKNKTCTGLFQLEEQKDM